MRERFPHPSRRPAAGDDPNRYRTRSRHDVSIALGLIRSGQVDPRGVDQPLPEQLQCRAAGPLQHDQSDISRSRSLLGDQADGRIATGQDKGLLWCDPRVFMERSVLEQAILGQQTQR